MLMFIMISLNLYSYKKPQRESTAFFRHASPIRPTLNFCPQNTAPIPSTRGPWPQIAWPPLCSLAATPSSHHPAIMPLSHTASCPSLLRRSAPCPARPPRCPNNLSCSRSWGPTPRATRSQRCTAILGTPVACC